ncbi:unnamed protein product [Schistosoma margrebowiei]|uniref:Uncharacterized protein n=1 Tax=Schistosoma margrebowiei TaxID=48269 RepID=A0A3P8GDK3_9TREM|nr:unnamed protein product [Schistosoma margrebowiei]
MILSTLGVEMDEEDNDLLCPRLCGGKGGTKNVSDVEDTKTDWLFSVICVLVDAKVLISSSTSLPRSKKLVTSLTV